MLDTQVLLLDSPPHPASALPMPFVCELTQDHDAGASLHLTGELDLATSPLLDWTLRDALHKSRIVVVDLRQVSFIDSSAIHVLVDAGARARLDGRRLVVLRGPAQLDRVLVLCGDSDSLDVVDLDAAELPSTLVLRLTG